MPNLVRLASGLLLGLCAMAADAADVTVRQFSGQVRPVLNPTLAAWVATQSTATTRSDNPFNAAALRSSAAAALGSRKATPENVEVLLALVLADVYEDAEQDIRRIATEIERNVAMKQKLRDVLAAARGSDSSVATDLFAANATLLAVRLRGLDQAREMIEDLKTLSDALTQQQLAELQAALVRASQAAAQISAILARFDAASATIIGNIRG